MSFDYLVSELESERVAPTVLRSSLRGEADKLNPVGMSEGLWLRFNRTPKLKGDDIWATIVPREGLIYLSFPKLNSGVRGASLSTRVIQDSVVGAAPAASRQQEREQKCQQREGTTRHGTVDSLSRCCLHLSLFHESLRRPLKGGV